MVSRPINYENYELIAKIFFVRRADRTHSRSQSAYSHSWSRRNVSCIRRSNNHSVHSVPWKSVDVSGKLFARGLHVVRLGRCHLFSVCCLLLLLHLQQVVPHQRTVRRSFRPRNLCTWSVNQSSGSFDLSFVSSIIGDQLNFDVRESELVVFLELPIYHQNKRQKMRAVA